MLRATRAFHDRIQPVKRLINSPVKSLIMGFTVFFWNGLAVFFSFLTGGGKSGKHSYHRTGVCALSSGSPTPAGGAAHSTALASTRRTSGWWYTG